MKLGYNFVTIQFYNMIGVWNWKWVFREKDLANLEKSS